MPTIILKRNDVSGTIPRLGEVSLGEVVVNTYDGKLFTKINNGLESIVELGGGADGESSELAKVDDGNGDAWRLLGVSDANKDIIGAGSVDLSFAYDDTDGTQGKIYGPTGSYSFASGYDVQASGDQSIATGKGSKATANNAMAQGYKTIASGAGSHAEGDVTQATGNASHAEGASTLASGQGAHAEGGVTLASGEASHAEGGFTQASGNASHTEGYFTYATADAAHAEGDYTSAQGRSSHAEGIYTTATGEGSHSEGQESLASGYASHAAGFKTTASGDYALASGMQYEIPGTRVQTSWPTEDFCSGYATEYTSELSFPNAGPDNGTIMTIIGNKVVAVSNTLGTGASMVMDISDFVDTTPTIAQDQYDNWIQQDGFTVLADGPASTNFDDGQNFFIVGEGDRCLYLDQGTTKGVSSVSEFFPATNTWNLDFVTFSTIEDAYYNYSMSVMIYNNNLYIAPASVSSDSTDIWVVDLSNGNVSSFKNFPLPTAGACTFFGWGKNMFYSDGTSASLYLYDLSTDTEVATLPEWVSTSFPDVNSMDPGDVPLFRTQGFTPSEFPNRIYIPAVHAGNGGGYSDLNTFSYIDLNDLTVKHGYNSAEDVMAVYAGYALVDNDELNYGAFIRTSGTFKVLDDQLFAARNDYTFEYYTWERSAGATIDTTASGLGASSMGAGSLASGDYSFASGNQTVAAGSQSHAEGHGGITNGADGHVENHYGFIDVGAHASHAEGFGNTVSQNTDDFAEEIGGYRSIPEGGANVLFEAAHVEGYKNAVTQGAAHAEGGFNTANGPFSHVEGVYSTTTSSAAHAEGYNTTASGYASHAEGAETIASGSESHAEGQETEASGRRSHAEGLGTYASGRSSHAEGDNSTSEGDYSHAEGTSSYASGNGSHAEGSETYASGYASHAEGYDTSADGDYGSHAEGSSTSANGGGSHAEGQNTQSNGYHSHAEGRGSISNGDFSHAEGRTTKTTGGASHAEGSNTIALNYGSHAAGRYNVGTSTQTIHETGIGYSGSVTDTRKNAFEIYIDGRVRAPELTIALHDDPSSLATKEYVDANAGGGASELEKITEGDGETYRTGWRLLGEAPSDHLQIGDFGIDLTYRDSDEGSRDGGATGTASFATGNGTRATNDQAFAINYRTSANGSSSFAAGYRSVANGFMSFAHGLNTGANADASHAEGSNTIANGSYSHAEGEGTIAQNRAQHVQGQYNVGTSYDTISEIGIGGDDYSRANAFEVYTDGTLTAPEATPAEVQSRGNQTLVPISYLLSAEFGNSLPTSDPGEAGRIWVDGGHLVVSSGSGE